MQSNNENTAFLTFAVSQFVRSSASVLRMSKIIYEYSYMHECSASVARWSTIAKNRTVATIVLHMLKTIAAFVDLLRCRKIANDHLYDKPRIIAIFEFERYRTVSQNRDSVTEPFTYMQSYHSSSSYKVSSLF